MIWEALSKLALLGTERGQLPKEVEDALAKVGVETAQEPEAFLLEGAALYHQLRRAGFPLRESSHLSGRDASVSKPPMPVKSARQLEHIVRGNFRAALPEAIALIQQSGYAIPPEHLPALLYRSKKKPDFWLTLRPLLDAVDFEMLSLNPDWDTLSEEEPAKDWASIPQPKRIQMLRRVRFEAPETATRYLASCWPELAPTEKKALINVLALGLGETDQAFLEEQLDDGRKEVRQAAALLLVRIPDSDLSKTLYSEASSWLKIQNDGRLDLLPPQKPIKQFQHLGLYTSKKHKYAGGANASRAFDILAKIPPKQWEAYFGKPTLDTLRLFTRANQQNLLTDAVANAALIHQDHRWIETLLRHWWRTDHEERWNSALGKQLMSALPDAIFNDIMSQYLRQHQGYIDERSFAGQLLCLGKHQWDESVARQVISNFKAWLNAAQSVYWNLWHYKRILKVAAYQSPAKLLPVYQTGWNQRSPVWGNWQGDVERFLKTLAFRKDLRENLSPPKTTKP
ncbi:MAG: hypothetical protein HRU12_15065 [Phaeodactylibacter sp.]|nr:hypothetical protein [Phaeodactylibacter sp.]